MIAVDRGDEPEALALERDRRLARAALRDCPPSQDDIKGYDPPDARKALSMRQQEKCAYCEKGIEQEGYPIEHFRPKLGAEDVRWDQLQSEDAPLELEGVPWIKDPARYWWLAWTWENLFFSCPACNSQKHKGNRFPLRRGSPRLDALGLPSAVERPLLIDPAELDPLDHIRFTPDYEEDNWRAIGLTLQGRWTILVLGLNDRPSLRSHRKARVRSINANHDLHRALAALEAGDADALQAHWTRAEAELLAPTQEFLALTWCVLDHHVPEELRAAYGLDLPRPGSLAMRAPAPLRRHRPELAGLPHLLEMRLRALGDHAKTQEIDDLLVAICAERPSTLQELCAFLRREPQYLRERYLARLSREDCQRLRLDPATGLYSCA
jgi:hypothetical protein